MIIFGFDEISEGSVMMKLVTTPIRQAVPKTRTRGLRNDFGDVQEDVLLLEGETHLLPEPVPVR